MQKSKFAIRERMIEFALEKKDGGPFWDRLIKEKTKYHWLKTDFNKWKDEDESEDEEGGGGQDLEEVRTLSASFWLKVIIDLAAILPSFKNLFCLSHID